MSSDRIITHAIIIARHNIALVRDWARSIDYKSFGQDVMRRYAVQYAFIVIGEALKDIPRSLLEKYGPNIPWNQVIGFRNWLSHTYDDLPDPRIMGTINQDLPALDAILQKMLADFDSV